MLDFSVIITTFNSEKFIENCLVSLQIQKKNIFNIEIIVVDNFSTDKTLEIARNFTSSIYLKGPERSAQRNFGILQSRSENIIFLDSDMIVSPFFFESLNNSIKKNNKALYIKENIIISNLFTKIRNFERSFYTGTPIDCVRYFKKSLFLEVGMFDEKLTGPEDWDFNNKILDKFTPSILQLNSTNILPKITYEEKIFYKNLHISINKSDLPCVYHDERNVGFIKHIFKKSYYSKNIESYKKKWGKSNRYVNKQLGFFSRFISIYMEDGKYKIFLRHFHLGLLVLFYKFFVFIIIMIKK